MPKSSLSSTDGYTFIELLLAITILALVVTPFLGLFTYSFSSIALSGRQTGAVNLCRENMESLKALGYNSVYDYYITEGASPRYEDALTQNPGFRRVTEVTPLSITTSGTPQRTLELLHLIIKVSWTVRDQEYSETVESYLARR